MKQTFQMKTTLLSVLLCAMGFIGSAQVADASNTTGCDVIVRFWAVDPSTCNILASDPTIYTIPAKTYLMPIAPAWSPSSPSVTFSVLAEVADAACGFPGVLVGPPPCGYLTTAPLPACSACLPSVSDNPPATFPPGGGGMHWGFDVHP